MLLKTLSLTQPWATLVAIGAKKIETRSWGHSHRGPIAIHAAKGVPSLLREIIATEPFFTYLAEPDIPLPLGAVIAIADLVDVVIITSKNAPDPDSNEFAFGDYTPGRYAWHLDNVRQLKEPIPARGALGLWGWNPPEGVQLP